MISSISALLRSNTIHSALVCTSTEAHQQLLLLVIKGTREIGEFESGQMQVHTCADYALK